MAFLQRLLSKPALLFGVLASSACSTSPSSGPSVLGDEEEGAAPLTLLACPDSPNCVSSLSSNTEQHVAPFTWVEGDAAAYQLAIVNAVEADGGNVEAQIDGYIWATYTSSLFRFVDDVEWLLNADKTHFDVRSASRTGYSDLGVNRKRVERLQEAMSVSQSEP
jgi:uncharacterized protein (DUF1499 family)